jgi:hypothetical protein
VASNHRSKPSKSFKPVLHQVRSKAGIASTPVKRQIDSCWHVFACCRVHHCDVDARLLMLRGARGAGPHAAWPLLLPQPAWRSQSWHPGVLRLKPVHACTKFTLDSAAAVHLHICTCPMLLRHTVRRHRPMRRRP